MGELTPDTCIGTPRSGEERPFLLVLSGPRSDISEEVAAVMETARTGRSTH